MLRYPELEIGTVLFSKAIGQYDAETRSSSTSRNGSSRSVQTQRLDPRSVSQLSELPTVDGSGALFSFVVYFLDPRRWLVAALLLVLLGSLRSLLHDALRVMRGRVDRVEMQ